MRKDELKMLSIKYDERQKTLKEVVKKIVLLRENQFNGENNNTFTCFFSVMDALIKG